MLLLSTRLLGVHCGFRSQYLRLGVLRCRFVCLGLYGSILNLLLMLLLQSLIDINEEVVL